MMRLSALLFLLLTVPLIADAANADTPRTDAAGQAPAAPAWLAELDALHDAELRVAGLEDHRFGPEHWWDIATPLLSRKAGFRVEETGRSVEDRPLRHASWGKGKTRVLLWSQMHGNESTASMALADLFRFLGEHPRHPVVQRLRANTSLHFFPIVNPDGTARFQRRNAQDIDINRDARMLASPEARTLKTLHDRLRPRFGFNLHDQRAGYRAGDSERGVAIALLAPPFNEANEVNAVRARSMEVAAVIRTALEPYIGGYMARWDDSFNPRSFGDLTTQWGTSTVLIEAGGIEGDPHKQHLRKLYFLGLVAALDSIASGSHAGIDTTPYSSLPENGIVWPDLRIDGGTLAVPGQPQAPASLLVNFRHPLSWEGGNINDIGDLGDAPARRVIDAKGLFIVPMTDEAGEPRRIATGSPAWFHLSRDPEGRDIVWTLARDLDPAHPHP